MCVQTDTRVWLNLLETQFKSGVDVSASLNNNPTSSHLQICSETFAFDFLKSASFLLSFQCFWHKTVGLSFREEVTAFNTLSEKLWHEGPTPHRAAAAQQHWRGTQSSILLIYCRLQDLSSFANSSFCLQHPEFHAWVSFLCSEMDTDAQVYHDC